MTEKPKLNLTLTGEFVKDGFDIAKYINSMGKELCRLSYAFYACGNNRMHDQLHAMFKECEMLEEAIRNLVDNETARGLKEARQASANVLMACLSAMPQPTNEQNQTPAKENT
jgi:hypothetical protein